MVENLVGYAKADLMIPQLPFDRSVGRPTTLRRCGAARSTPRCIPRSARSRCSGWPSERELLRPLPSLRPEIGIKVVSRKVDKLSCIRFGSARYSVPCRLIGQQVTLTTTADDVDGDRAVDRGGAGRTPAWSARVRPASTTPTTTGPARTGRTGHPDPEPKWRRTSARSDRPRRRSWSARPRPVSASSAASSPTSSPSAPRTAPRR